MIFLHPLLKESCLYIFLNTFYATNPFTSSTGPIPDTHNLGISTWQTHFKVARVCGLQLSSCVYNCLCRDVLPCLVHCGIHSPRFQRIGHKKNSDETLRLGLCDGGHCHTTEDPTNNQKNTGRYGGFRGSDETPGATVGNAPGGEPSTQASVAGKPTSRRSHS